MLVLSWRAVLRNESWMFCAGLFSMPISLTFRHGFRDGASATTKSTQQHTAPPGHRVESLTIRRCWKVFKRRGKRPTGSPLTSRASACEHAHKPVHHVEDNDARNARSVDPQPYLP